MRTTQSKGPEAVNAAIFRKVSTLHRKLHVTLAAAITAVMTIATLSAATAQAHPSANSVKLPFHATELNRAPNFTVWTDSTEINRREWPLPALIRPTPKVSSQAIVKPRPVQEISRKSSVSRSRNIPVPAGSAQQIGFSMMLEMWPSSEWPALRNLWDRESGWDPNNVNTSSGACGIPQALPCSKIQDHSIRGQIAWGLGYIKNRYGSPSAAWAHSENFNWY